MKLNVKCYANLSADGGCNYREATTYDMPERARVQELVDHVDFGEVHVQTVFVNGRQAGPDDTLAEGDRIGLFPAVGGM